MNGLQFTVDVTSMGKTDAKIFNAKNAITYHLEKCLPFCEPTQIVNTGANVLIISKKPHYVYSISMNDLISDQVYIDAKNTDHNSHLLIGYLREYDNENGRLGGVMTTIYELVKTYYAYFTQP